MNKQRNKISDTCGGGVCPGTSPECESLAENYPQYEARARILKALSHPTRLFMVDKLGVKEYCVAKLTGMVDADMSTVSKHLAVLKSAGLVSDEKRGQQVYYSLRVPCILNFFGCIEETLRHNAEAHMQLLNR